MDQRIGVQTFHRGGHFDQAIGRRAAASQPPGRHHQAGAQPFAAIHRRIAHGRCQPVGWPAHLFEHGLKMPFDSASVVTHRLRQDHAATRRR